MNKTTVFLRVPASVADRVRAAIVAENRAGKREGRSPSMLVAGRPSLAPWFARAGEREVERIERGVIARPKALSRELTVNVNFDVDKDLAARCVAAIHKLNRALAEHGERAVCLRVVRPSLPPFFLRAGLLELDRGQTRNETRLARALKAIDEHIPDSRITLANTTPGRTITLYARGSAGHAICEQVRTLLRERARKASVLARCCPEFPRLQVSEAIAAMRANLEIEERDGLVRLTEGT